MLSLCENRSEKGKELRSVVVDTLQELMKEDAQIVALEADLGGASKFTDIQKSHPDRFIQCGIAEANMVGVAAGLSVTGFKPFLHSFGPFATRRVFDQIFLSGAYAKNTLNIYGSDPGFTVGPNGGTHTTWEDIALMSSIPGAIICDPADAVQCEWIVRSFSKMEGIHYLRANRKSVRNVYAPGSTFTMGKGIVVKEGKDVLIITSGQLLSDALDCAENLQKEGIECEVIDMFCVKPLDQELILARAKGKKAIITFENHNIHGGLGSMVAALLAEKQVGIPFLRHGVEERFGQVGTPEFLQEEFRLTAKDLEKTIHILLGEKQDGR